MKKAGLVFSIMVSVILLVLAVLPLGCVKEATSQLNVVTTTTEISSIVEKVGGDKVQVESIIPAAQCPGEFDVKPGDIQMLTNAKLFLMESWTSFIFTADLIKSANNPNLKVEVINTQGNWMVPAVQAQAVSDITSTLAEIDPQNATYYQNNAKAELAAITATGNDLEDKLIAAKLTQVNVICDSMLPGLPQWAGFNVVASYPSYNEITPKIMQQLIDQGKQSGVALVIGNLQSGTSDDPATIASGIGSGAVQVTLSNFPGGFPNTETWEKAIDQDVSLILGAMTTYRGNSH